MTLYKKLDRNIPDYYPTMYMDGYTPEEILHAVRRQRLDDHESQEDGNEIQNVKITSEVKVR